MEKRYDLGEVDLLKPVAMGVPGRRTFFLIIGEQEDWVRVWLEKEVLASLALAIDQFLEIYLQQHSRFAQKSEKVSSPYETPSGMPAKEFEIQQIALRSDPEGATLILSVHFLGLHREESAEVYCQVTPAQLKDFSDQAKSICAAGRPRCTLCGNPIDPTGHICPKCN